MIGGKSMEITPEVDEEETAKRYKKMSSDDFDRETEQLLKLAKINQIKQLSKPERQPRPLETTTSGVDDFKRRAEKLKNEIKELREVNDIIGEKENPFQEFATSEMGKGIGEGIGQLINSVGKAFIEKQMQQAMQGPQQQRPQQPNPYPQQQQRPQPQQIPPGFVPPINPQDLQPPHPPQQPTQPPKPPTVKLDEKDAELINGMRGAFEDSIKQMATVTQVVAKLQEEINALKEGKKHTKPKPIEDPVVRVSKDRDNDKNAAQDLQDKLEKMRKAENDIADETEEGEEKEEEDDD